jgi:hypothetical protein
MGPDMEVTVVKGKWTNVDANKEGELLHICSQSANLRFYSHLEHLVVGRNDPNPFLVSIFDPTICSITAVHTTFPRGWW